VYDFTGSNIYPDLSEADTRSMDMDSNYVLVVSKANPPHLLALSDIKEGKIDNPIKLDVTGIQTAGVTFYVSSGRLSHGHIYMCSLSVLGGSTTTPPEPLNIYYWDTPTSKPQKIGSFSEGQDGIPDYVAGGGRFGDCMSIDLDENGNGYIFLGNNRGTIAADPYVYRFTVTGFTDVSNPTQVNPPLYGGWWTGYNRVDGSDNEYLYTGAAGTSTGEIMLVTNSGSSIYTMDKASVPAKGNDARIVSYNGERYLIVESDTQFMVYDVTKGDTTEDALKLFEESAKMPRFTFAMKGNSGTLSDVTGVAKTADALYLMGAAPNAGFIVVEVPKAINE
jgi:hypothetical protein